MKLTNCCKARVLKGWPNEWRRPSENRVLCTYCGATLRTLEAKVAR